jgi:hypothetical protein
VCGDDAPFSWDGVYFHPPNLGYWSGHVTQPGCVGCGDSWIAVTPEQEKAMPLPDTQTRDYAIETLTNLSKDGFGTADKPFFVAVGFHKVQLAPSLLYLLRVYPDRPAIYVYRAHFLLFPLGPV